MDWIQKKIEVLDFEQLKFLDTELLQKKLSKKFKGKYRKIRADIIIRIGLKGMNTKMLICIIVEHKSHIPSFLEVFSQIMDYDIALIEAGECPVMNILLLHGKAPSNMPSDLKSYLGWTPKMKSVFGDSGLNCGLEIVDLSKKLDEDIEREAGLVSALCFALKHVWDLTLDKIRSIFHLIQKDKIETESDKRYVASVMDYMLQASDYPKDVLGKFETEIIKGKEGHIMLSTYDRLIDEGLQKGRQEGLQEGLQEGRQKERQHIILNLLKNGVDISTIVKATGIDKEQVLQLQKTL